MFLPVLGLGDVAGDAAVDHLEASHFALEASSLLGEEEFLVDEVVVLGFEFNDKGQRSLEGADGVVHLVAVEGEALLQTQGVAATQTGRHDAELLTSLEDLVPHLDGFLLGNIDLASASAGVTGGGEDDVGDAGEGEDLESVVLHVDDVLVGELLHSLEGVGALDGELSPLLTLVDEIFTEFHAHLVGNLAHPVPVFIDVGGVGHHEVLVVMDAVDEHVVDHATLTVGEAGVLHLAVEEVLDVVGGDILHEVLGDGAFGAELAHVAHVEHAHVIADIVVLFDKTGVLDRHVVAGEFGHLCTKFDVQVGVRCGFHYVTYFY